MIIIIINQITKYLKVSQKMLLIQKKYQTKKILLIIKIKKIILYIKILHPITAIFHLSTQNKK
jgi:hypothetical protein